MSISLLFTRIYQTPPAVIVTLLLGCTLVFLLLHRHLEDRRWWRGAVLAALLLWTAAVLWVTILNRSPEERDAFQWVFLHSYRELQQTGNREILLSNFMNGALFYPAGVLLGAILPKRWRLPVAAAVLVAFSLSIELSQYALELGRGEMDDVLHNTLGGALGCFGLMLGHRVFPPGKQKK